MNKEMIEVPFTIEYYRTLGGSISMLEGYTEEELTDELELIETKVDSLIEDKLELTTKLSKDLDAWADGFNDGSEASENSFNELAECELKLVHAEELIKKLQKSINEYHSNVLLENTDFCNVGNFEADLDLIDKYFEKDGI